MFIRRLRRRLPSAIAWHVGSSDLQPVDIGASGSAVFRISRIDGQVLFLKAAVGADLGLEAERLQWLTGRVPVPEVLAFSTEGGREYLLMRGVPGVNGVEAGRRHPDTVAVAMARALKRLHAHPADDCPFDETVNARIEQARWRAHHGLVDETDFDPERRGRTALDLLAELDARRPESDTRVLTHGDACLPNVIIEGPHVTGFVDCGRVGIADRYQDLALASRSIEGNLGVRWCEMFFQEYGLPNPDRSKLDFYRLLDEFF